MKCFFLGFFLVVLVPQLSFGQSTVNDFSFVSVPEHFEFLNEKDKHQLNSLTRFLFNKYGFNAYFSTELPNVKRCDGLYADVLDNSNFIYTRVTVILHDCNGLEIFRSEEGKSKLKEYKKAYHEALRQAFESIALLEASQPELKVYEKDRDDQADPLVIEANPKAEKQGVSDTITVSSGSRTGVDKKGKLPQAKFTSFQKDGRAYLLRNTGEGYAFYEETDAAADGLQLLGTIYTEGDAILIKLDSGKVFPIHFDAKGNMVIQDETATLGVYLLH